MTSSPIAAIFSTGRAGSTWLGSIVSSHPEVVYRFEPLRRMRSFAGFDNLIARLRKPPIDRNLLEKFYDALLPAHPLIEKPPFFIKTGTARVAPGRQLLWPLSRRCQWLSSVYARFYTPVGRPMIVFKEVGSHNVAEPFFKASSVPCVYLIRHPCGVIWSQTRGKRNNHLIGMRHTALANILRTHGGSLSAQFDSRIGSMTVPQQYALLWRIDVERCIHVAKGRNNVLVIYYEDLCLKQLATVEAVFQHFGLTMSPQTKRFLADSSSGRVRAKIRHGEIGVDPYFTVFRRTDLACWRWRSEMPADDQRRVLEVTADSPVFGKGVEVADWPSPATGWITEGSPA